MTYTIKQLADLSGASTRTLRHYDAIGLLKPAYYGDNNYRYYDKAQLLLLQQILFFKDTGLKLENIQKIITNKDFDMVKALLEHRTHLLQEMQTKKRLISTIDKTLSHLKDNTEMTEQDMYLGFKHPSQIDIANYIVANMGYAGHDIVAQCKESITLLNAQDIGRMTLETKLMSDALKMMITQGLKPYSDIAQSFMAYYYETMVKPFVDISCENFINLV
jgi:DNA-binding transcriptional MerR regulator